MGIILTVPREQAIEMVNEEVEDFEIQQTKITGQSRWKTHKKIVLKRLSDGKFFWVSFSSGSTEQQESELFEGMTTVSFTEVEPYERTIIDFRPVA